MPGTFFDHQPGRINARFRHGSGFDTIVLRIRMSGAVVTTTPCDDQFQKGNPVNHVAAKQNFSVCMTSVWCPFADLIRFLEAIVIQVRECSFDWDAEGPCGVMKWERRFVNKNGFLTVEWHSRSSKFEHRMMLDTKQAVRMLYTAFRRFVESPEYDFLRYEEHTIGEALVTGLGGRYSQNEIVEHIKWLDLKGARKLLNVILQRSGYRHGCTYEWKPENADQIRQPMEFDQCMATYGVIDYEDSEYCKPDRYIRDEWAGWDAAQREADLLELLACGGSGGWYGAPLREMRSTIIEEYLSRDSN